MSYASSHTYETVYILRPSVADANAGALSAKVDSVIEKFEGAIKSKDDWGMRELAYPIDNEGMGKFNVVVYTGKGGVVDEIERHFKISNDVLRFMTVNVEADYDYGKNKKAILAAEEEMKKIREAKKKGP
ncbi:30S ribosomal protein S6 [bacterium]|nr:30S ribosomal protein S6 [bacterium]